MDSVEKVREFIHSNPRQAKEVISRLFDDDHETRDEILYDFKLWARPEQMFEIPKGKNQVLLLAGRGWGKTHWITSHIIENLRSNPNKRIGLMAADFGNAKKFNFMGESGLINLMPPSIMSHKDFDFNKSDLIITMPNGSSLTTFSSEAFEKTRSSQFHNFYCDEAAAWIYDKEALEACWLTNRLEYKGEDPKLYIATTPRPTRLINEVSKDDETLVIKGTTYQNYYLSPTYVQVLKKKLSDRMFRQECLAEVLDDNLAALFKMSNIDLYRVKEVPELKRIIVAIDPAVSANPNSDDTGIIVAGLGHDNHAYILEDATMEAATPEEWSRMAIDMYYKWNADRIVAEKNQGGLLVQSVIRAADKSLPPCKLVHATKGKVLRAEPISAYYEHGEVHHVGRHDMLEQQMTEWDPTMKGDSPDRLDALVWACTELLDKPVGAAEVTHGEMPSGLSEKAKALISERENANNDRYGNERKPSKWGVSHG